MRIHHLGIAVKSLSEAVPIFETLLGEAPVAEEAVPEQKVRVAVFNLEGGRLEILEATAPDSPVARFVAERGPGIHHLTLTVPDLEVSLAKFEQAGFRLVNRSPRAGAGNTRVAFLHPNSTAGVLIELVEES